jgi:ABC-type multidrug transport system fused ATPase/permease subunit
MLIDRRLLGLAGPVRWPVTAIVLLGLAVLGSRVVQAFLLAAALADALTGRDVLAPAIGLAATVVARCVLQWLVALATQRTAQGTKLRLREALLRKLLDIGPGYLSLRRTGEVKATIVDGVEAVETYFSRYLPAVLLSVVGPLVVLVVLLAVAPWVALAAVVGLAMAFAVLPVWNTIHAGGNDQVFVELAAMDAELVDTVQGLSTLKAFNASAQRRKSLAAQAERVRVACMRQLRVTLAGGGMQRLAIAGTAAVALVVAVVTLHEPGAMLAVLFLVPELFRPLEQAGKATHDAFGAQGAVDGIVGLLSAAEITPRPAIPAAVPTSATVDFEAVTFRYPTRDVPAVSRVSFAVEAGQTLAVVGPSGSGKSTLASLLLRFLDPDAGVIRIGGRDLRSLSPEQVRERIALVAQDTYLFHGTIAENIALGRPGAGDADVRAAADAAGVDEFVRDFPQGYDTEVGERGAQLSGGQRQRIAIARALLKDAPILVLDEATSSVDGASETLIQRSLERLTRDRTTIVIAHRLSTVRDADRIIVLADGMVVESGTHDTLTRQAGIYAQLVSTQGETR